ncbi:MAG TPA: hypothetical protein VFK05_07870, partial [Polyangiaceae bacterium]|nr:hypothetical protein [Polyangiaceae bacterium]
MNTIRSLMVAVLSLNCALACETPEPKTCPQLPVASVAPPPVLPAAPALPPAAPAVDHYAALADEPFEGGYPSKDASAALSKELYFQRAVQAYLWALPAVNMFAMKEGLGKVSGTGYQVMSVFEKRLKPMTIITTPNSDVIYGLGFADLSKSG